MAAIFVLALFLSVLFIDLALLKFRGKIHPAFEPPFSREDLLMFGPKNFEIPAGIFLSKGHTWIKENESGDVEIGIDPLGAMALGPSSTLKFTAPGKIIRKGETLFEGSNGDKFIKFRSPVNGIVKSINPDITVKNISDPYSVWSLRIISNDLIEERRRFLSGSGAADWMKREYLKLKSFIDSRSPHPVLAGETMYDGGMPAQDTVSMLVYRNAIDFEKEFLSV